MTPSSPVVESARNVKFVGYCDQGGRPDGVQVMVNRGHAYVSHPFSAGASVIDVRDPRQPKAVNFLPVHPRSWSLHLQTFDDLLLVVEEFNFYSVYNTENSYYGSSIDGIHSSRFGKRGEDFSAGLRVYDIKDPANPQPIGFMEVEGLGLHRVWWVGGRYAFASAILDGFSDHILISIDMQDPTKPREVGRFWLPGMWRAGGETADWPGRVATTPWCSATRPGQSAVSPPARHMQGSQKRPTSRGFVGSCISIEIRMWSLKPSRIAEAKA